MSKIAVIVTNDVEDIEYTSPVDALKNAGHEVVTIENKAGNPINGKHGLAITADKGIADVSVDDFDGLLIPGFFHRISYEPTNVLLISLRHSCWVTNLSSRSATALNYLSKPV